MSRPMLLVLLLAAAGIGIWLIANPGPGGRSGDAGSGPGALEGGVGIVPLRGSGGAEPEGGPDADERAAIQRFLAGRGFPEIELQEGQSLVVGRVLGGNAATGAPIPLSDAVVTLFRIHADGSHGESALGSAATRPDGRYFATIERAGGVAVRAESPGYLPGEAQSGRILQRLIDMGDLVLVSPAALTVLVTTGVDTLLEPVVPVSGFDIEVRSAETVVAKGKTDDTGRFVAEDLAPGQYEVHAKLAPYAAGMETVSIEGKDVQTTLNLQVVGRLKVRARAETGAILTAFAVAVDILRDNYGWMSPRFAEVEAVDDDGFALVEGVKAGKHEVYATAGGLGVGRAAGVEVRPGETTELEVTLPPGFPVSGKVVAKGSGEPVAGAIVFSERDLIPSTVDTDNKKSYLPMARAARTDVQGRFRIEDLTAGTHALTATHPEFADASHQGVKLGKELPAVEVTISLPQGATLTGHVYDLAGQPVQGDQVMVIGVLDRNSSKKAPRTATTDAQGFYSIPHVPAGPKGVIRLWTQPPPGGAPYEFKMHNFKDGAVEVVDFGEKGEGGVLRGRITDAAGQPAPDIGVSVARVDGPEAAIPEIYQGVVHQSGDYEIRGIKAGVYRFSIAGAARGSDFAALPGTVAVRAGEIVTRDIVLDGGVIEGTVVTAGTGQPLQAGEVVLLDGERFIGRAALWTGGRYRFPHVPAGSYTIAASGQDHGSRTHGPVTVQPGETTLVPPIELDGGGRIAPRGRLPRARGPGHQGRASGVVLRERPGRHFHDRVRARRAPSRAGRARRP
jgi:hypothetical protein